MKPIEEFDFKDRWFSNSERNFWEILHTEGKRSNVLEIGSHEGMSACWMLMNLIKDDGRLYCVDVWEDEAVHERFHANVHKANTGRQLVVSWRQPSIEYFAMSLWEGADLCDFIYIDGSHEAHDVLQDCVLAWKLLKPGCLMLLDDYEGGAGVKQAAHAFMSCHQGQFDIEFRNYQLCLRKQKSDPTAISTDADAEPGQK